MKLNHLKDSKSPYLLQHAHNPVDWYPWGEEALAKAKKENKPILLSIGYSSCHWCHVMAHESFEDTAVANLMNTYFVNIKLDREERPDIDQIYMDAVHAMGINGGWPLNVFLTPDQKPFYGGTYFPKENWKRLLHGIHDAYQNKKDEILKSAEIFTKSLNQSILKSYENIDSLTISDEEFTRAYENLASRFDKQWGGVDKAPKFPMFSKWFFLLHYAIQTNNKELKEFITFTLDKISDGGIYDHIGGGFARYSVDGEWHVPHFEKMLYDNGQMLNLYAEALKQEKQQENIRLVIKESIQWLQREMLDKSGGFYAALDADSEGEEGKFYVWSYDEISKITGKDAEIIYQYYDVQQKGNWEHTNVLRILYPKKDICENFNISEQDLASTIQKFKNNALAYRSKRIRPGLDNKIITSWNALTLTGLLNAYQATGNKEYSSLAKQNYHFIKKYLLQGKTLKHTKDQDIIGFADDYATTIQAFIKYYETFFDEEALTTAKELTYEMINTFFDSQEKMFFYTSNTSENLIARKHEIFDNVIPASNSIMAENLIKLGLHFDDDNLKTLAKNMTMKISSLFTKNLAYLYQWAETFMYFRQPVLEIITVGKEAFTFAQELNSHHIPYKIIEANTTGKSKLPLMQYKTSKDDETTIYVCYNKVCKQPVYTVADALKMIEEKR